MENFKLIYLKNYRIGYATNSSSTHSIIYKNDGELLKDVGIFENDYFGRFDRTIASTKEAKIKYILANIMRDFELVKALEIYYPEMKQYYYLVKKQFELDNKPYEEKMLLDGVFGCTCRGSLKIEDNIEFNVKYLRYIIDNPDIAIVGGSDEEDFVYDTISGHDGIRELNYHDEVIKNGNYYIVSNSEFYRFDKKPYQRLRYMVSNDDIIPSSPELIDLKITNKCNHGCPFCFMDSNMNGADADFDFLCKLIDVLNMKTEFSIGGGNVLLYPKFKELITYMKNKGHITNITLNSLDVKTLLNNIKLLIFICNNINGVGISIVDDNGVTDYKKLCDIIYGEKTYKDFEHHPELYVHLIPELLGAEKTIDILKKIECYNVLFLGYKTNGRGCNIPVKRLSEKELNDIFNVLKSRSNSYSIDTTFGNTYKDYIEKNFSTRYSITLQEGEFSMYVDGVEEIAYKSSYQTEKPYKLWYGKKHRNIDYDNKYNLQEAFNAIRKDNGLKTYTEYYNEKLQEFYNKEEK